MGTLMTLIFMIKGIFSESVVRHHCEELKQARADSADFRGAEFLSLFLRTQMLNSYHN